MEKDITKAFGTGAERRREVRHEIKLNVNYSHGDTYLFSKSGNLSEMGIFLITDNPLAAGTIIELRFDTPGSGAPIEVTGEVVWIDPGNYETPTGMGLRFINPDEAIRNRIRSIIRTIAYLD